MAVPGFTQEQEEELRRVSCKDAQTSGSGGFRFNSPADLEQIRSQRSAIWDLLRNLGSQVLSQGISLTNVSMPVRVFEPRSFLERICLAWAFFDLLEAAADCRDPADRLRLLVGFVVGGLRRQASTLKPFNPILGETFQAELASADVFLEQTCHHPPVSSWEVPDRKGRYRFHGSATWSASARGNSIRGQQGGLSSVCFASDGATVTWTLPPLLLKGILWGERVLKFQGSMVFTDVQNNLRCEVTLDAAAGTFLSSLWSRSKKKPLPDQIRGELLQGDRPIDTVTGSWLSHVEWDKGVRSTKHGRRVWDAAGSPVREACAVLKPLPSDCRHREDLATLKAGDRDASQDWKSKLEERQRADRRLRQQGRKLAGCPVRDC